MRKESDVQKPQPNDLVQIAMAENKFPDSSFVDVCLIINAMCVHLAR